MKNKINSFFLHKLEVETFNKFFVKPFILKTVFVLFSVIILSLWILPSYHRIHASGSFTVSNVTFDPTTGILKFDYTGTFDNGNVAILQNGGPGINLWQGNFSSCTMGTCVDQTTPGTQTSLDYGVTSVTLHDNSGDVSQVLNYPLPYATTNSPMSAYTSVVNGWVQDGNTWTYASADSPTFTATTSGDLTGIYTPGMRIKLTQSSTIKYFLITGVSFSSPNTTITLYGGTDYTLANSTISNIYFSTEKAPLGFPLDPAKWSVEVSDSPFTYESSPTANTWYNIGGDSITVPIGIWELSYSTDFGWDSGTAAGYWAFVTLSTSSSSQSDADMTKEISTGNNSVSDYGSASESEFINLTSKTTYYLDEMTGATGLAHLYGGGNPADPTNLKAVSSYL